MTHLDIHALLASRRLLLVGGKGGVGKTTTSAALAVAAAETGRKVLLASTDPAHSLADAFDHEIGDHETMLAPNLTVLELDPDNEVDAYLSRVSAQMRRFAGPDQVRELERQLRLSRQSPGAQEAALLERLARLMEEGQERFDLIILDTAPTGHTLRLLSLPEVMAAWTDGLLKHNHRAAELGKVLTHLTPGRDLDSPLNTPTEHAFSGLDDRGRELANTLLTRQRLFQRTRRLLADAARTAFLFVLTPEKLPILETERAVQSLIDSDIPVAGLIINRVLPDQADGSFFQARHARQLRHLADIEARFHSLPQRRLPLLEDDIQGLDALLSFSHRF